VEFGNASNQIRRPLTEKHKLVTSFGYQLKHTFFPLLKLSCEIVGKDFAELKYMILNIFFQLL
jgi:hypothetical protein